MAKQPMTKKDIIAAMAKDAGMDQIQAEAVLNSLVDTCRQEVENDISFRLAGLGTFSLKKSKARNGVNPATGEAIKIPAKKRMAFKPGTAVRELLNPAKK